ncbi:tRNA (adenosine(37)-N6)-threonylcarbamoyltransferase complex dimerization subunit type 1 TsaB [bacterium]|nr:tRNA (adenosine(37)-N6)-threonylcarbamoyltransferase complex dimerization subunit type 1 TsaB [bacterium]
MSEAPSQPMLAIDTAGPTLRMAIGFGEDRLVKYEEKIAVSHGRVMLKKIDDLLQSSALTKRDLRALAVSVGPGSFTGLRIGLSMAKGLATALDLDMVGVSAFELAAYRLSERPETITVLIPFKKDSCFAVDVAGGEWIESSVRTIAYGELPLLMEKQAMVAIDDEIARRSQPFGVNGSLEIIEIGAADLIHVGRKKLERGDTVAPDQLEPLYLQKSQAEIRYDQRRRSQ